MDDFSEFFHPSSKSDESLPLLERFSGKLYFQSTQPGPTGYTVSLAVRGGRMFYRVPEAVLVLQRSEGEEGWPLNTGALREYAASLLDILYAREKAPQTVRPESLAPPGTLTENTRKLPPLPNSELRRLVGALLDAADAIESAERNSALFLKNRNPLA